MKVLFVCKYNRFRSKAAEALFLKYCKESEIEAETDSCGIVIDESRPYVAEITKLLLSDKKARVKNEHSKRVSPYLISWADKIIIVADDALLEGVFPKNKTEVWDIKDVSEHDPIGVSNTIEEIDKRVQSFVLTLKKKVAAH